MTTAFLCAHVDIDVIAATKENVSEEKLLSRT